MKKLTTVLSGVAVIAMATVLMSGCGSKQPTVSTPDVTNNTPAVQQNQPVNGAAKDYTGKKVLFVDSYHEGYAWSDGLVNETKKVLDPAKVEVKVVRMDTKRNKDKAYAENKAKEIVEISKEFKPDAIVATDDNASKYVIMPYFKDSVIPVVEIGCNWDDSIYGYPYKNSVGMIEALLPTPTISALKEQAKGQRIGYLGEPTETGKKDLQFIKEKYGVKFEKEYFPKDYQEFKKVYLDMQKEVDMMIFENYMGIQDFDKVDAEKFVMENTKIPTGALYSWVTPLTTLGVTTDAQEFGEWAGETVLKILDGTPVSDIAKNQNQKGIIYINKALSDKVGSKYKDFMLKNAQTPPAL